MARAWGQGSQPVALRRRLPRSRPHQASTPRMKSAVWVRAAAGQKR
jgi:hypothetical protein